MGVERGKIIFLEMCPKCIDLSLMCNGPQNRIVTSVMCFLVQRLMKANRSIEDDDLECVEQNQRFRLSCPITLMRIMIPARGDDCRHLQCFDLESFIQVTKGSKAFNNRWKCPECPLILRNDAIVIDPFVSEILKIVR